MKTYKHIDISSVQSHSHVWLFATPWTTAQQASLSVTNSQSLLKLISIKLVMPFNHLILCHPLLLLPSIFLSIRVFFLRSQFFASGGQSIRASTSASVLEMSIQDWFPLGLTGLISWQCQLISVTHKILWDSPLCPSSPEPFSPSNLDRFFTQPHYFMPPTLPVLYLFLSRPSLRRIYRKLL